MTIVPDPKALEAVSEETVVEEVGAASPEAVAEKESTDGDSTEPTEEERIEAAVQAALAAEREALKAQSQQDLNGLRSSLDSQLSEAKRSWDTRESDYQSEIHKLNMANMDEGQRTKYELDVVYEELDRVKSNSEQLETRLSEQRNSQDWLRFFTDSGIDPSKMDTTQGLQGVIQTGMAAMTERMKSLEGQASGKEKVLTETLTTTNKKAPKVVTKKGAVSTGPGWDELIKKHGSEEAVYQMVQEGSLPATIIPGGSEE